MNTVIIKFKDNNKIFVFFLSVFMIFLVLNSCFASENVNVSSESKLLDNSDNFVQENGSFNDSFNKISNEDNINHDMNVSDCAESSNVNPAVDDEYFGSLNDDACGSDNLMDYYYVNSISDFNGKENLVQVDNDLDPIYSSAVASNCYFVSQDFTTSPSSGENFTVTFFNTMVCLLLEKNYL